MKYFRNKFHSSFLCERRNTNYVRRWTSFLIKWLCTAAPKEIYLPCKIKLINDVSFAYRLYFYRIAKLLSHIYNWILKQFYYFQKIEIAFLHYNAKVTLISTHEICVLSLFFPMSLTVTSKQFWKLIELIKQVYCKCQVKVK